MTQINSNSASEEPEPSDKQPSNLQPIEKGEFVSLPSVERDYEALFKEVSKLDENDLVVRKNCKFCNHPNRFDAELKWEKSGGSFAMVQKYFDELCVLDPTLPHMTYQNIRDHVYNHYKAQERKIFLREYSERLRDFINYKTSRDKMFEAQDAALEMQLFDIASSPNIDSCKKADVMCKIGKLRLEILLTQQRLKGELNVGHAMVEKFMNVWLHLIGAQKDEQVRKGLMDALDSFQSQIEGLGLGENASG